MVDTVNFSLTRDTYAGGDFLEGVPPLLNPDTVAQHDRMGLLSVTGRLGILKVTVTDWQIKVGEASLCKWYLGDNCKGLMRRDIEKAIEKLSDELHLPMHLAKVTRLDVADNIVVRQPVSVYLGHMGALSGFNRLEQPNTLYYTKSDRTICLYDKKKELRAKREIIPDIYRDANVLRYEYRYMRRIGRCFKRGEVTGSMLYDEDFYVELLKGWRDSYRAISKVNEIAPDFSKMTTKLAMYRMGLLHWIRDMGGEVEMLKHISEARTCGCLSTKQAYDLRETVKDVCKERDGLTVKSDAIAELDKKIAEAVMYYR